MTCGDLYDAMLLHDHDNEMINPIKAATMLDHGNLIYA